MEKDRAVRQQRGNSKAVCVNNTRVRVRVRVRQAAATHAVFQAIASPVCKTSLALPESFAETYNISMPKHFDIHFPSLQKQTMPTYYSGFCVLGSGCCKNTDDLHLIL